MTVSYKVYPYLISISKSFLFDHLYSLIGYLRKLDTKDKKIMDLSTELAKSKVVIEELQSTNKRLAEENYFLTAKKQDKK